jgi:dipeptidyl aminopeptidase/acylaminoacyl peptidase
MRDLPHPYNHGIHGRRLALGKRPLALDDYWAMKIVDEMDVSRDGKTVAYVVTTFAEETNSIRKAIWVAEVESGETRQLTSGEAQDSQPAWSPDGSRLAFVSTRHEDRAQLFVVALEGGEAKRVTTLPDGAAFPAWSPDNRRLCVTSPVKSARQTVEGEKHWFERHDRANASVPRLRKQTTIESRFDARGYIDHRFQIYVVDVDDPGGEPRAITEGDVDHVQASWSPSGDLITYVANCHEDVAHTFATDIWTMRPDGSEKRQLTNGEIAANSPAWSPDGQTIAFYAHPLDTFAGKQHVWTVSHEGGDQRDVSAALDRTRRFMHTEYAGPLDTPPAWSPDGQNIYCLMGDHNDGAIFRVSMGSGHVERVSPTKGDVAVVQCCGNGERLICIASTPTFPYDIFTVPSSGGHLTPLTNSNRDLLDEVIIVEPEDITFKGAHGWDIEGWLVPPVNREAGNRFPLILEVHGGPQAAWPHAFTFHTQAYAGAGYGSLYINPRGSLGRGFEFVAACDWGDTDFFDQMAGIDLLVRRGDADADRLGVTGISYGGFMTNWIVGHTERFAAAVSVNGVANLMSLFGTSDICAPWFMGEFEGPFWTGPEQWERYRHHSPIMYAGNVTTPVLFIQAETDFRCPIEQGEQMFTALRMQEKTAELIRVPGASHSIADSPLPHQRYFQWKVEQDWFDRFLRGNGSIPEEEAETAAVPAGPPLG